MRCFVITLSLFLACGCSAAKDDKSKDKEEKIKPLAIGDPVPPLAVDVWLNGAGIKAIEPGKIYLFDFWATWCGPCIEAMPDLAQTAREYADKNVVVIPVTTLSNRNGMPAVEAYVEKVGKRFGLTFGVCRTKKMEDTWYHAAGAEGFPTTLIVDKEGKLAFIGQPMEVADVLPQVVDGTWKGDASVRQINAMNAELGLIEDKAARKPQDALAAMIAFEGKYPAKAKQPNVIVLKLVLLMQNKKFEEAKATTEKSMAESIAAKRTSMLEKLMAIWVASELNPEKKHVDLSLKALDALFTLAGKEPSGRLLFNAAEIHHFVGNKTKAIEYLDAALKVEENPELKRQMAELGEQFRK